MKVLKHLFLFGLFFMIISSSTNAYNSDDDGSSESGTKSPPKTKSKGNKSVNNSKDKKFQKNPDSSDASQNTSKQPSKSSLKSKAASSTSASSKKTSSTTIFPSSVLTQKKEKTLLSPLKPGVKKAVTKAGKNKKGAVTLEPEKPKADKKIHSSKVIELLKTPKSLSEESKTDSDDKDSESQLSFLSSSKNSSVKELPFSSTKSPPKSSVDYDSDTEININLEAQKAFFKRSSRKEIVKTRVGKFEREYKKKQKTSSIRLDGLSSRSRIMLFQSVAKIALAKKGNNYYFGKYVEDPKLKKWVPYNSNLHKDLTTSLQSKNWINFEFGYLSFGIKYSPTADQPGNFVAYNLPKNVEILKDLCDQEKKGLSQQKTAKSLKVNKKTKTESQKISKYKKISILLDLEIARRCFEGDTYQIPVASAIAIHTIKSSNGDSKMSDIFSTTKLFEGFPFKRKTAAKEILCKERNSTFEEIRQTFLSFYGGESESEEKVLKDNKSNKSQKPSSSSSKGVKKVQLESSSIEMSSLSSGEATKSHSFSDSDGEE